MLRQVVGGCAGEEGRGKRALPVVWAYPLPVFCRRLRFHFIFVFVSFYMVDIEDDFPFVFPFILQVLFPAYVGDDVLYLMQLPDVPGGYRRIKNIPQMRLQYS